MPTQLMYPVVIRTFTEMLVLFSLVIYHAIQRRHMKKVSRTRNDIHVSNSGALLFSAAYSGGMYIGSPEFGYIEKNSIA